MLLRSLLGVLEYVFALRVPIASAAVLVLLPLISFRTSARSLLRGLFDVTPFSLLAVTLAAFALAGTITDTAAIIYIHSFERLPNLPHPIHLFPHVRLLLTILLPLPVLVSALVFSLKQRGRDLSWWLWPVSVLVGLLSSLYLQSQAQVLASILVESSLSRGLHALLTRNGLFDGYVPANALLHGQDPWIDHIGALTGFSLAFLTYLALGFYGWWRLGKTRTVPALCSVLMLVMLFCWTLAGVSFFFDLWRIPLLLIVMVVGWITAQSGQSDHFYTLIARKSGVVAPSPAEVLNASSSSRIIVVAANGGGIQAAAWTAQVLDGLRHDFADAFVRSLRFISSVSGGSVGSVCFVYSLAESDGARNPARAAAESSLDEVAWGLGWPDLLRSIFPWVSKKLIGRGRALEKAWCLNSASRLSERSNMDQPLSDWNEKVAQGQLPAVVLNATISESGARLLLATTRLDKEHARGRARIDAAELHTVDGQTKDVGIVTAARLSATFPYVTPASRSTGPGPQPHIVDGGYYDNYGMSTLVEWLDEGLTRTAGHYSILVLQIHGAPVNDESNANIAAKIRGWFYQAIAPLSTMTSVRSAAQVAHNDTELELLQQKWSAAGVPVHTVTFEFPDSQAPLSWHLTPADQQAVAQMWAGTVHPALTEKISAAKQRVRDFLAGSDALNCPCPVCRNQGTIPQGPKALARSSSGERQAPAADDLA